MKRKSAITLRQYCLGAVFAAVIFVATAFIKVPIGAGYVHIGDAFIFLAAAMLPGPVAVSAAVIGASMADLLAGYALWIPATAIIKALTAFCFTNRSGKMLAARNFAALIIAAILCAGGYYLYEVLLYWNFIAPAPYIVWNLLQTTVSAILFVAFSYIFDSVPSLRRMLDEWPKQ